MKRSVITTVVAAFGLALGLNAAENIIPNASFEQTKDRDRSRLATSGRELRLLGGAQADCSPVADPAMGLTGGVEVAENWNELPGGPIGGTGYDEFQ